MLRLCSISAFVCHVSPPSRRNNAMSLSRCAFALCVGFLAATLGLVTRCQPLVTGVSLGRNLLGRIVSSSVEMSTVRVELPERIIVGYANWNQCDEKIVQAVQDGVNVLIWFSINLAVDAALRPTITNGPNWDCVAEKTKQIRDLNLPCVHLISIGGWNSPHPDSSNTAEDVFAHWDFWNRHTIARPALGFHGFDGFDWDIEGNDSPLSPYNTFTVDCLDLMGRFSQLAKAQGYLVAMAPAESYLDPTTSAFDRSLLHEYPEWEGIIPPFAYHGHNTYAYLLSKYGTTEMARPQISNCDTFDFITVQLYEGYSHAEFNVSRALQAPDDVLVTAAQKLTSGWMVDYSGDADLALPAQFVSVPPHKLVIGLANGWAGEGKFLLVYPHIVAKAYSRLQDLNIAPRGFAFWNILDEGLASKLNPDVPVFMARGLNEFLRIR